MIINADMRDVMPLIPTNTVDSCVTDTPYHLDSILKRFGATSAAPAIPKQSGVFTRSSNNWIGHGGDAGDIAFKPETWCAVLRVLKPGAHLLAFAHSTNYHRMATAIEAAGFQIRDQIMWLYGTGMPKSHKVSDTMGTALKPAHEPIVLARKPLSERTIIQNVMEWDTGGIEVGNCKIGDNERWPANVIHDGLPQEWSRFFYHAKASHSDRVRRCEPCGTRHAGNTVICPQCGVMLDTGHPTVKPLELMRYLCRLVTPAGGTVLDPFAGTGSTMVAARDEGFQGIGVEMLEEYYLDMKWRLYHDKPDT